MEATENPTFSYAIDGRDALVSVSDPWIRFAAENEAPGLTRDFVVGRPIWDFVEGEETRELYRRLFSLVRQKATPRVVPFRCDSPSVRRFMELQLVPVARSGIELTGVLLRETARVYCAVLDRALPRADYCFPFCSVCNRIFAFGLWLEADEAVERLGAFDTSRAPALEHGVCDACRRQLESPEAPPAA